MIHQVFSLARDWSKHVTWANIPQLKLAYFRTKWRLLFIYNLSYSHITRIPLYNPPMYSGVCGGGVGMRSRNNADAYHNLTG